LGAVDFSFVCCTTLNVAFIDTTSETHFELWFCLYWTQLHASSSAGSCDTRHVTLNMTVDALSWLSCVGVSMSQSNKIQMRFCHTQCNVTDLSEV